MISDDHGNVEWERNADVSRFLNSVVFLRSASLALIGVFVTFFCKTFGITVMLHVYHRHF